MRSLRVGGSSRRKTSEELVASKSGPPNKRVQRTRLRSPLTRRPLGSVRARMAAPCLSVLIESLNGEMISVSQERALMVPPRISLKRETVAPSGVKTKVSVRPSA